MSRINFIGYFKKPFDFEYITDKILVDSLNKYRNNKDEFIFSDWNNINFDLYYSGFSLKNNKIQEDNLSNDDLAVILEIPTRTSTHTSIDRVYPILEQMVANNIRSINSAETFIEYKDKSYLLNYPNLPFPKTKLIDGSSNIEEYLSEFGNFVVLKPIDTDGGYGVVKLPNDSSLVDSYIKQNEKDSPFLLQEYLEEIVEGERSLFFFNKEFKYAMLKKPKKGGFKSNEDCVEILERYSPSKSELKTAYRAIYTLNSPSLLERVDMTNSGKIIEMTIDCPGLYLVEAGIENEIGEWFSELIDFTLENKE
ncbi:MAG: hypothetical protein QXJ28_01360 [Candidatus Pacearchaeota archaeon]